MAPLQKTSVARLRRHADYQRVYRSGRKQFSKQMSYYFATQAQVAEDSHPTRRRGYESPRVGITVGKVMGRAVDRNRIKRRMREVIRQNLFRLRAPVDVVLHPRRSVIDLDYERLREEVGSVFQSIQRHMDRSLGASDEAPQVRSRSEKRRQALTHQPVVTQTGR